LVIIAAATIWIVASLIGNSGSNGSAKGTAGDPGSTAKAVPDESRPVQTYTAQHLYAMFHANEIKANNTIGDAIVRFSGVISSIQQSDFSKTPELDIRADCFVAGDCEDAEAWNTFRADLKASEMSTAAKLKIGQTVTLQCDEVSMPVDVYAKGCSIVSANDGSASPK
jgi:hypothetical protein